MFLWGGHNKRRPPSDNDARHQQQLSGRRDGYTFTLQHLRDLISSLMAVGAITPENEQGVIEALRAMSEVVVLGENREVRVKALQLEGRSQRSSSAVSTNGSISSTSSTPTGGAGAAAAAALGDRPEAKKAEELFALFCEKNMMARLIALLRANRCSVPVQVQVIQTTSILVMNVHSDTSLYFLLSNNHINDLIQHPFDFNDEEVLSHYISLLKTLALRLSPSTVQFFFVPGACANGEGRAVCGSCGGCAGDAFPLYSHALRHIAARDSHVRIAALTVALHVHSLPDPQVVSFLSRSSSRTAFFSPLVGRLASQCEALAHDFAVAGDAGGAGRGASAGAGAGSPGPGSLREALAAVQDSLYYLQDVFDAAADRPKVCEGLASHIIQVFVQPLLLDTMLGSQHDTTAAPSSSAPTATAPHPTPPFPHHHNTHATTPPPAAASSQPQTKPATAVPAPPPAAMAPVSSVPSAPLVADKPGSKRATGSATVGAGAAAAQARMQGVPPLVRTSVALFALGQLVDIMRYAPLVRAAAAAALGAVGGAVGSVGAAVGEGVPALVACISSEREQISLGALLVLAALAANPIAAPDAPSTALPPALRAAAAAPLLRFLAAPAAAASDKLRLRLACGAVASLLLGASGGTAALSAARRDSGGVATATPPGSLRAGTATPTAAVAWDGGVGEGSEQLQLLLGEALAAAAHALRARTPAEAGEGGGGSSSGGAGAAFHARRGACVRAFEAEAREWLAGGGALDAAIGNLPKMASMVVQWSIAETVSGADNSTAPSGGASIGGGDGEALGDSAHSTSTAGTEEGSSVRDCVHFLLEVRNMCRALTGRRTGDGDDELRELAGVRACAEHEAPGANGSMRLQGRDVVFCEVHSGGSAATALRRAGTSSGATPPRTEAGGREGAANGELPFPAMDAYLVLDEAALVLAVPERQRMTHGKVIAWVPLHHVRTESPEVLPEENSLDAAAGAGAHQSRTVTAPAPGARRQQQEQELRIFARSHAPPGLLLRDGGGVGAAALGAGGSVASGQEWSFTLRFENATSRRVARGHIESRRLMIEAHRHQCLLNLLDACEQPLPTQSHATATVALPVTNSQSPVEQDPEPMVL